MNPNTKQTSVSVREIFHRVGFRVTRQRKAIYEALQASCTHPSAEELHASIRAEGTEPSLSLATVYNTLDAMTRVGLCRRLPSSHGATRFDADLGTHVHLVLPDGRVVDLPHSLAQQLIEAMPDDLAKQLSDATGEPIEALGIQLVAHTRGPDTE